MESTQSLFDLNKEQLLKVLETLKPKLNEFGYKNLELGIYRWINLEKGGHPGAEIVIRGSVSYSLINKCDELEAELLKLLAPYGEKPLHFDLQFGYLEGEKFPRLTDLTFVPTKEIGKTFECPVGEVVLVDFWATWCGPCQGPMQHNQDMLEKNQDKWKGKARIVGVSFDKDVESVIKRVEEKKWDKVEHYYAPGGFDGLVNEGLRINGIPTVYLLDKKGIIRFIGHPSEINLEEKINELIAEDENTGPVEIRKKAEKAGTLECTSEGCSIVQANPPTTTIGYEAETDRLKSFKETHEAHKHLLANIENISPYIFSSQRYTPNGSENRVARILLNGKISVQDKPAVDEYWKNVILPFSNDFETMSCLDVESPVFDYKYGASCATCKKTLGKGTPHYLCTLCQSEGKQDHAFCFECANKEYTQEIKSGKELFHEHGLLLLNEDSDKALSSLQRKLHSVYITPDDDPDFAAILTLKACRGFCCDGCGEDILNYRWGCANCDNFDYCSECFKASRDPTHEKHQAITGKGHDNSHVFYRGHYLMTLYPPNNSYEYPSGA